MVSLATALQNAPGRNPFQVEMHDTLLLGKGALIDGPRRSGKSHGLATYLAASLLTVPDTRVAVHASRNGGKRVLEKVREQLLVIGEASGIQYETHWSRVDGRPNLCVKLGDGDLRIIRFWPTNGKCRGSGGTIIVVEEADQTEMEFIKEVILPCTGMGGVQTILTVNGPSRLDPLDGMVPRVQYIGLEKLSML